MLMIKFQKHRKCGMQGKFSIDVNKAPNVKLINSEYAGLTLQECNNHTATKVKSPILSTSSPGSGQHRMGKCLERQQATLSKR